MENRTEKLYHLIRQAKEKYSADHLVVAIPGFLSKKFIAYCSMREDIILLLDYIALLREEDNQILKSALCYSLISLYGKCYTDASRRSLPKLEPNDLFQNEPEKQETHEFLMELRHEFIAHRGETDYEIGVTFMLITKASSEQTQIRFNQIKLTSFSKDDLNRIESLFNFLKVKLEEKIQKLGQKVKEDMLSLFTPEELSKMLVNNAEEDKPK